MKMKLMAALVVLGAGFGAQATTTALGAATVGAPLSFGGFSAQGTFNDIFTFTLPVNGGSGYSVTNFTFLPGLYNTVLATASLVSNADTVLFNLDDTVLSTTVTPGGNSLALTWGPTAGGSYYLNVTGIANGAAGGIYNGAISVVAVPVPEPETFVMMLAGLGALAFLARRRHRD